MKKEDLFKQTYRSTGRREIFARVKEGNQSLNSEQKLKVPKVS